MSAYALVPACVVVVVGRALLPNSFRASAPHTIAAAPAPPPFPQFFEGKGEDSLHKEFLEAVEGNSKRYLMLFAEAADALMPQQSDGVELDIYDWLNTSVRCSDCCWCFAIAAIAAAVASQPRLRPSACSLRATTWRLAGRND